MKLKKIRNLLCIAVLLIAAAGTFVLFAYPRFVEPVVKYNLIHLRNLLADLFLVALRQASGHDQRL